MFKVSFKILPFPLHWPSHSLTWFGFARPSLQWWFSSLFIVHHFSSLISSRCRPGLARGTSCEMMLKGFYCLPLPHRLSGLKICTEEVAWRAIKANKSGLRPSLSTHGRGSREAIPCDLKSYHHISRRSSECPTALEEPSPPKNRAKTILTIPRWLQNVRIKESQLLRWWRGLTQYIRQNWWKGTCTGQTQRGSYPTAKARVWGEAILKKSKNKKKQ